LPPYNYSITEYWSDSGSIQPMHDLGVMSQFGLCDDSYISFMSAMLHSMYTKWQYEGMFVWMMDGLYKTIVFSRGSPLKIDD